MADPVLIGKITAAVLQNEKARKALGWVITAILSPLLLLLVLLAAMLSGGASHNTAALKLCFEGGAIPPSMPAEYRAHIRDMRESFSLLEKEAEKRNERMEEDSLDTVRIRAVFYALYFGGERPSRQAHRQFVDCFTRQEERTRITVHVDEEGNEFETEEAYTVTVPIEGLEEVYRNLSARMGLDISNGQKENADSIYHIVRFGYAGGGSVDAPFIGADGFCSPIGENWRALVTSEFGLRADPFTGKQKGHTGLDLAVPSGTPIRAALPGTVRISQYNQGGYGYYILIDHADGLSTLYAHNSRLLMRVGETVDAGDVIALSGSTGRSTGPHLHFEVRVNGERANPRSYLP